MMTPTLVLGAALWATAPGAPASAAPPSRFAIVVGNNISHDARLPALRYADDDALATALLFRRRGAHVQVLTRADDDTRTAHPEVTVDGPPTRAALTAALERTFAAIRVATDAGQQTEFHFFFSGHGGVENAEGFVVLEGGRLTRHELQTLVVQASPAQRNHVMVDACRSYFMAFERGGATRRPAPAGFSRSAFAVSDRTGFMLSTSSDRESHEWEQYRAGVFSHLVLSGLWGAADADLDGRVTYAELGAWVHTASAGVASERYRPDFLVTAPGADPLGTGSALMEFPSGRDVLLDVPDLGHVYVEDATGRRLADLHPASGHPVELMGPGTRPLYVRSADEDHEWVVAAAGPARLSELPQRDRRDAARGAVEAALVQLFVTPYGPQRVADHVQRLAAAQDASPSAPDPPPTAPATRLRWRPWVAGAAALALVTPLVLAGALGMAALSQVILLAGPLPNPTSMPVHRGRVWFWAFWGVAAVAGALVLVGPALVAAATGMGLVGLAGRVLEGTP